MEDSNSPVTIDPLPLNFQPVQTNKSTGITHQLRNKLNFNDEKLWKRFSSRRLELIDSMKLSEKKASEQDLEILNCVKQLMLEFNYNDDSQIQDFIKLVQVAIQSVRRNRKRSTKSKKLTPKVNLKKFVIVKQTHTPTSDDDEEDSSSAEENGFKMTDILTTDKPNTYQHNTYESTSPELYSSRLLPLNSLLQPVLPNSKFNSNKKLTTKLPSFSSILQEDHEFGMMSPPGSQKEFQQQLFTEKEIVLLNKLLALIKKSKTCNDLSTELVKISKGGLTNASQYENLEVLGSTIILSTISFIFEKFFTNLNPSSISYLILKLNNDSTLTKILRSLDLSLSDYYQNDFIHAQTFKKLIGCCIKDFGFDTVINPLTDIIHEIILKDYPLISKNSLTQQSLPSTFSVPSPTASIITTSSTNLLPHLIHQHHHEHDFISVALKFQSNHLNLKFNAKSSSMPTFIEILENSKDSFNIRSKYVFIKNLKNGDLVQNDEDVSKIFHEACNTDNTVKLGVFVSDMTLDTVATPRKRDSLLDTLSDAAEMVESRSNASAEAEVVPLDTAVEEPVKKDEKIVFQRLL